MAPVAQVGVPQVGLPPGVTKHAYVRFAVMAEAVNVAVLNPLPSVAVQAVQPVVLVPLGAVTMPF